MLPDSHDTQEDGTKIQTVNPRQASKDLDSHERKSREAEKEVKANKEKDTSQHTGHVLLVVNPNSRADNNSGAPLDAQSMTRMKDEVNKLSQTRGFYSINLVYGGPRIVAPVGFTGTSLVFVRRGHAPPSTWGGFFRGLDVILYADLF